MTKWMFSEAVSITHKGECENRNKIEYYDCKSDVSPHNVSSTADKSTLIIVEKSARVSLSSLQKQGMTLT